MTFFVAVETLLRLLRFFTFIRSVTFSTTIEALHGLWRFWAIALTMSQLTAVEAFEHWFVRTVGRLVPFSIASAASHWWSFFFNFIICAVSSHMALFLAIVASDRLLRFWAFPSHVAFLTAVEADGWSLRFWAILLPMTLLLAVGAWSHELLLALVSLVTFFSAVPALRWSLGFGTFSRHVTLLIAVEAHLWLFRFSALISFVTSLSAVLTFSGSLRFLTL